MLRITIKILTLSLLLPTVALADQARHYFSRKLKWGASDFSSEKSRGG